MPGTNHTINYKTVSVMSALMLVPPKAMQVFATPLADITPSNDKVWFLIANAGTQIQDKIFDLVHLQQQEGDDVSNVYTSSRVDAHVLCRNLCS